MTTGTQVEIDIENRDELLAYLMAQNLVSDDTSFQFEVLHGGVSNRTVHVTVNKTNDWVIKQALEKLRVAIDWYSDPKRIHVEATGLRWLNRVLPTQHVPQLVHEDDDHHILIMTAVKQPHQNWKELLLSGHLSSQHVVEFASILASLHHDNPAAQDIFADRSYFKDLRLEPYYQYSSEQVPEAHSFLQTLVADTLDRQFGIVHGDYSPKNVLVHDGHLVILDYEVMHYGDPAFDIGFSMTHLLSKAHYLPDNRQDFILAAHTYWDTYNAERQDNIDPDFEGYATQHTLGCLLARAVGRSQLEYFEPSHKQKQVDVVLHLLQAKPGIMHDLIDRFHKGITT